MARSLESPSSAPVALSLKQPWATLLVHGLKSIEVRTWQTRRLGRVFIHASKIADERDQAWRHVPVELAEHARLRGGIVGDAELFGVRPYWDRDGFAVDLDRHRNELDWFEPPRYGFLFRDMRVLPFRPLKGQTMFFRVPVEE